MADAPYRLSNVHDDGGLVLVRCGLCRRRQHYAPADIKELFGDLPVRQLDAIEHVMRCAGCGDAEFVTVKVVHPSAAERVSIKLRRLAEVKTVRRPVWRDEA